MTIWTMNIECVAGCYLEEDAAKICEIENTFTLEELFYFILESFDFNRDHMHGFFIAKTIQNNELILEDESQTLQDIFPLEKNQQLFMRFDFGDDWVFKITHSRTQVQMNNIVKVAYPRIVEHIGKNPKQYPMYED